MNGEIIIDKLLNAVNGIADATKISVTDFTEERDTNMIVIGVDNVEQVNFSLPDYKYTVAILVDTIIQDDTDCTLHKNTCKAVDDIFEPYTSHLRPLDVLFEEAPVVGMIFKGKKTSMTQSSYQATYTFEIITSEEDNQ